ncbi:MAG: tetratricopeptide repeat protein [Emcibacteraceae bacterium]|nr:tetratricopeptide repeat protein [Emcibacteraceae bacterium]MDG1996827.1 tetratricopeptide repeat protein [Emcibacteraceae bacterium]
MNNNDIRAIQKIRKYINEQKFDKALSRANRIIRAEDKRARRGNSYSEFYKEAYNSACISLTGLGKVEEALEACNTSIGLTPTHWESLKTRATLYYMVQEFPKSLEDFTTALENAPDDAAISNVLKQNIDVVKSKIQ